MKVFDSGMPEEAYWASLFDVPAILAWLDPVAGIEPIVEIGCGYGTFTVPIARSVSGEVLHLIEQGLRAGTTPYPVPDDGSAVVRVAEAGRPDFRPGPGSPFASNRERRKALFEWLKAHPLLEHPEDLSDPVKLIREDRDSR